MKTSRARTNASTRPPRRIAARRSFVLIWVAFLFIMLIGFTGLALDTAYSVLVGNQLTAAAESASLGAALQVTSNPASIPSVAAQLAHDNFAAGQPVQIDSGTDVAIGSFNLTSRVFTPNGTPTNAVRVRARRSSDSPGGSLALFFGSLFGVPTVDLTRSATAMVDTTVNPGLLVLDPHANQAFNMSGSASITVLDGTVQVNSDHSSALNGSGSANVSAAEIDVTGGYRLSGGATADPNPSTDAPIVADPRSGLATPPLPGGQAGVSLSGNQHANLTPGYYTGGINLSGNSSATLAPGIYILDGVGLRVSGSSSLSAANVMFYVKGAGSVDVSGNGAVTMTPPQLDSFPGSADYAGITLFQDRADTQTVHVSGSASTILTGLIYVPAALTDISGSGDGISVSLIVNTLNVSGSGNLYLTSGGASATGRPFLVE